MQDLTIAKVLQRTVGLNPTALTMIEARAGARPLANDPRASLNYKYATFSGLKRGDCILSGEFRFYEDGSSHWECDIGSTDSGDEWDGSFTGGETGYDGSAGTLDKFLFALSPKYHFDIHDSGQTKHWVQDEGPDKVDYRNGVTPSQAYQLLGEMVFYCGC